jgi:hypothetical protein
MLQMNKTLFAILAAAAITASGAQAQSLTTGPAGSSRTARPATPKPQSQPSQSALVGQGDAALHLDRLEKEEKPHGRHR